MAMPAKRIPVHISFPSAKERDEAAAKARERGRSLSGQIQWYFRTLPHIKEGSGEDSE